MRSTLLRVCSSTMTRAGCTKTTRDGWKSWPLTRPSASAGPEAGCTTAPARTNADAHLKRQTMGREVVVAVTNGRLDSGTWERIFRVSWMADTGV